MDVKDIKRRIFKDKHGTSNYIHVSIEEMDWCVEEAGRSVLLRNEIETLREAINTVQSEVDKLCNPVFKQHVALILQRTISMTDECGYCTGRPLVDREPLMKSQETDYSVFINSANCLEDSVIGGSVPHSLYGVKIKFCPMCSRKLN